MGEADPADGEPLVLTADERTGTGPAVAAEARRFLLPVSAPARPSQSDPRQARPATLRLGRPPLRPAMGPSHGRGRRRRTPIAASMSSRAGIAFEPSRLRD